MNRSKTRELATKRPIDAAPVSRNGYTQADDEWLLLRFRNHGDRRAFNTLVRRYEKPLFNYLYGYLHNRELAEEVFQITFLRVHEKSKLFTEDRKARPWIYSIATHEAVDALRREGRHQAVSLNTEHPSNENGRAQLGDMVEGDSPTPMEASSDLERAEWTRRAVIELPSHLRVVVLLVFYQNLKYREVAEILDIPVGTVKSRLHSAVCELAQAWQREHPNDLAIIDAPRGLAKRACNKVANRKRTSSRKS
jgi:RNA polymerase sigma-70 factor (ECF subfamily)